MNDDARLIFVADHARREESIQQFTQRATERQLDTETHYTQHSLQPPPHCADHGLYIVSLISGSSVFDLEEAKAHVNTLLANKAFTNLRSKMGRVSYAYSFGPDLSNEKLQAFTVWLPKHDSLLREQILETWKVEEVMLNGNATRLFCVRGTSAINKSSQKATKQLWQLSNPPHHLLIHYSWFILCLRNCSSASRMDQQSRSYEKQRCGSIPYWLVKPTRI